MNVSNVIALLSGVALFLFGMSLMGDGLKKVAGSKLELVLYRLSSTPLRGVLLGTVVTAIIQSSSATSVMVVGFVNSGMMKVLQAIGVVLGANLGTSITGWVLCLSDISGGSGWVELISTATLSGIVAIIGIILRMFCKEASRRHVGDILMGFAVLMVGMQAMSGAVAPLKESETFIEIMTRFSNPLLGILVGILLTCILQSASASVGILQALSVTGAIRFEVAHPLVLGIAIGAAMPVLFSAVGAKTGGKRTAFVYLIIDVVGVLFWCLVFYPLNAIFRFSFTNSVMNTVSIAALNTLFRFVTTLVLTPVIPLLEKLMVRLIPDKSGDEQDSADMDRLEDRFLAHPSIAVEQSNQAMIAMARKASKNLYRSFHLLDEYTPENFQKIQDKEAVVDKFEDKIGTYLVKLTEKELTHAENKKVSLFLHTISDFERISDHAVNLSETAREIFEKKLVFSEDAQKETRVLVSAVTEIVNITTYAFTNEDMTAALRVEPLEQLIDDLCDEVKLHHVRRVQTGDCTLAHGFVFNDLLTNLERVADHCSNVAVAMIELQSEVFDTHKYQDSLKEMRSATFNQYFEEYSSRFVLKGEGA